MFFGNIIHNTITKKEDLTDKGLQNKIPDGAIYFEGIVSNSDKNRNGYIIDSEAWFFDKSYVKNFLKTGSVLYGHDSDKPIGRPLTFEKSGNDVLVSGYVFDDVYTNGAIGRGLILGLSTGHITHERMYENNKTGKRLTEEEFWGLEYDEIFSDNWTMIVTKAEIVEFSFTATPSNRKSVLVNEFSQKLNKDPKEVESLFLKYKSSMNKKEENNIEATKVIVEEKNIIEEVNTLKNEVETLKNDLIVKQSENEILKTEVNTYKTEVETLKNTLSQKDVELNTLKDNAKKKVMAEIIANEKEKVTDITPTVNTLEGFTKKWGNK